jgi:hypothetical protein
MGLRGAAPSAGLRWRFVMSHPSRAGACERCSVYTLTGDACAVAPAALRGAALGADGRAAYVFRLRLIVRIRIQLRRGTAHSWRSLIRARDARTEFGAGLSWRFAISHHSRAHACEGRSFIVFDVF